MSTTYALLAHTASSGSTGGPLSAATADNMFAKATVNGVLTDSATSITLSSNQWTHSATGTYQIQATICFGYTGAMGAVSARCGLYNVTSSAFAQNKGSSSEIISTPGIGLSGTASAAGDMYMDICGRYDVVSTADQYAIYMAGKATTGAWFSSTFAQGIQGSAAGSKPEYYKLIQIIKE